ncbi:Uncharacterized membrane protein specific for M.kandleri, MK-31 family [Methanopyrus kandleri AV19]|uniref:Uncharacterized membrane protein specific for M.kandleri, MK-31 family n=1 Tax=Methanopyrus kandleri (strain AV19 / DSM 6324 / JCM 9639 / NBRC 100938) TaxID=190192 RepID=Q8TVP6_METKA|nr:Uncharacterized membrane protein specific for M.kandleri, MK-31 family [Methanopyrus kandleri AV19]
MSPTATRPLETADLVPGTRARGPRHVAEVRAHGAVVVSLPLPLAQIEWILALFGPRYDIFGALDTLLRVLRTLLAVPSNASVVLSALLPTLPYLLPVPPWLERDVDGFHLDPLLRQTVVPGQPPQSRPQEAGARVVPAPHDRGPQGIPGRRVRSTGTYPCRRFLRPV